MKCISCDSQIDPKWSHAISNNICPFCGKVAIDQHLSNLLIALKDTMNSLLDYPDQVNDWLLSNHGYIKTDSPDIAKYMPSDMLDLLKKSEKEKNFQQRKEGQKFTVKVQTDTGEEEVEVEKIQPEEVTNEFFRRADVIKKSSTLSPSERTEHLKKMVNQIKKTGGVSISETESANPEEVAEYESMMEGSSPISDGEEEIPPAVLAMAANKSKGGPVSAADLLLLQKMQDRKSASNEAFQSGENRGKGGFSRV